MKPSRRKRKEMKQKANAKAASKSAESTKKKQKRHKVEICFHYTPPIYIYRKSMPLMYPKVILALDKRLRELDENVQIFHLEQAKSHICQGENGSYVCSVCGTEFSKDQWEQMDAVVKFLNDGGEDEKKLKTLYDGLCPVRYYRTTEGVLVAEKVEEGMEIRKEKPRCFFLLWGLSAKTS